jgi:hypothetical protein
MKRYIKANDENTDYGFGFDSNGDAIDESTVEELYRIAENEILPGTILAQTSPRCSIDADTFEYVSTGTAFGAYLKYTIYIPLTSEFMNISAFMRSDYDGMHMGSFDDESRDDRIEANLNAYVDEDNVTVEVDDIAVYDNGTYSDYWTDKYSDIIDWNAVCEEIKEQAEGAAREIKGVLSML